MAFLLSASAALFGIALGKGTASPHAGGIGYSLIAIGAVATLAGLVFYRGNRLHSETAAACRKLLAKVSTDDATPGPFPESDPIWVRRKVEQAARFPFYNPDIGSVLEKQESKKAATRKKLLKIEQVLSLVFFLVPIFIIGAGILVLARIV